MKLSIYHNNRCSKSRQCLALIPQDQVEIIDYLKNPPSKAELKELLRKLDMPAANLIRKGEAIWKEQYKGKSLTENDYIDAMTTHPKLIERPIVVKGDKALVCRPPELVKQFL